MKHIAFKALAVMAAGALLPQPMVAAEEVFSAPVDAPAAEAELTLTEEQPLWCDGEAWPETEAEIAAPEAPEEAVSDAEAIEAAPDAGSVPVEPAPVEPAPQAIAPESIDSEALFQGYVGRLFFGEDIPKGRVKAGDRLEGSKRVIYDLLVPQIKKVAAGKRTSSEFILPIKAFGFKKRTWTLKELDLTRFDPQNTDHQFAVDRALRSAYGFYDGYSIVYTNDVLGALRLDYPYEMYWASTSSNTTCFGVRFVYKDGRIKATGIYVKLYVSGLFRAGEDSPTRLDTRRIKVARAAAKRAKAIVRRHAAESDYQKLLSYRDEICDLVDYDHVMNRIDYEDPPENDPDDHRFYDSLIAVFDGNAKTKAVCTGYAKAFQYLCDLSSFKGDVNCCFVTGSVGNSNHAWNIVHMPDGKSYLADVTFCDTGSGRSYFMKGCVSGSVKKGYGFRDQWRVNTYTYSDDTLRSYGKGLLAIGTSDYREIPASEVKRIAIAPAKPKKLKVGRTLQLEYSTAPSGASDAVKWSSSRKSVATVSSNGLVTAKKPGTTRITVKTSNGKKATVKIRVIR